MTRPTLNEIRIELPWFLFCLGVVLIPSGIFVGCFCLAAKATEAVHLWLGGL